MNATSLFLFVAVTTAAACSRLTPPAGAAAERSATGDPSTGASDSQAEHASPHPGASNSLHLSPDALRDLRLTMRKAERRPASDAIHAVGSLEFDPAATSAVSTPLAGRIVSIAKNVGDRVEAGQDLVEVESIDVARASASLDAARSRVAIGAKRLTLAEEQRDRVKSLVEARMTTIRDQQAAESEVAARTADVAEAEALVRDAERVFSILPVENPSAQGRFRLRAATTGVLTMRDGVLGESIEAGHVLFRIATTSPLHAVVHPFERDGARIDVNSTVRLTVSAHPGRIFDATFVRTGPEVEISSRTLPVRLAVPNADGSLLPGMSVTAEIRLGSASGQEVVTVPLAAVQRVELDWCVFLPRSAGVFERRTIARGRDLGGEVEVLSGLAEGDEVVVEGAFVLRSESTRRADSGDEHEH